MNESQSAELICSATGDSPILVYWNTTALVSNHSLESVDYLGMIPMTEDNKTVDFFESLYYDNNSSIQVLSIYAAVGSDNGYITCVAENEVGQGIAEASLEINGM